MNFIDYLERQQAFSERTFGPGPRVKMVLDHLRKELVEIENNPTDLEEWIDVVMLALDGAWRAGYEPHEIADQLSAKLYKNEVRTWPDWRLVDTDKAIEHIREPDAVRELLEQDERDRQFLAEHGSKTIELLAQADRIIESAKQ
jgi:tagatose-1,6-bisphosphate aldolase non-catalytic subunit AgaZ/GatZ